MSSKTSYYKLRFVEEDTYFKLTGIETNIKPQYCHMQTRMLRNVSYRLTIIFPVFSGTTYRSSV